MPDAHMSAALPASWRGAAIAGLGLIDLGIISRWLIGDLGSPAALLLHLGAVAALLGLTLMADRRDAAETGIRFGFALLFGPPGGVALACAGLWQGAERRSAASARARSAGRASDADEAPPSAAQALFQTLQQNRRPVSGGARLGRFEDILATGDLDQQQRLIAAISLGYDPRMMPALKLALGSETPAVRVQAAAVYSKLLRSFGARAKELVARDIAELNPEELYRLVVEIREVTESGFVNAQRLEELAALEAAIRARLAAGPERRRILARPALAPATGTQIDIARPPSVKRYSCGGLA